MKDIKILLLEGGFNEEHEISIATGNHVKSSLRNLGIFFESMVVSPNSFEKDINKYSKDYICFNALHGTFGEDGKIQKILDNHSFRYSHSSSKASHIGFNKELTKKSIEDTSVLTPRYLSLDYLEINENNLFEIYSDLGPFVIKPVSSGSSFGIKIFKNEKTIDLFVNDIKNQRKQYLNHKKLLIEKYIKGRELTVSVIERNNNSEPVEVTEIISNNDFFDYQSKYTPGFSKHILPAKIPKHIYENCKMSAKIVHEKINCKGISRSDFIYDNDQIYFLEINTQPGLTSISLVPEQLKYQKISFDEFIFNIINSLL